MVARNSIAIAFKKASLWHLLVAFILGIVASRCWLLPPAYYRLLVAVIILLALLVVALGRSQQRRLFPIHQLCCYLFFMLLGLQQSYRLLPYYQQLHYSHGVWASFVVRIDDISPRLLSRTVRAEGLVLVGIDSAAHTERLTGRVIVQFDRQYADSISIQYGDVFLIRSRLRTIAAPQNPKEFDYQQFLHLKSIYHILYTDGNQAQRLYENQGSRFRLWAIKTRDRSLARLEAAFEDSTALQLASALLFGDKSSLHPHTRDVFAQAGIVHILTVSGLHVGLVFYVINWLLSFLRAMPSRPVLQGAITLLGIWTYVLLTGLSPPILRAGIMISFVVLAQQHKRYSNSLNACAASAFMLLYGRPYLLFDVGFQLSYVAVVGILLLYPVLLKLVHIPHKGLFKLYQLLAFNVSAQCYTSPLSIYYFGIFPVYFMVSNLFIALPLLLVMYIGFLSFILPEPLSSGLFYLLEQLLRMLHAASLALTQLPYAYVEHLSLHPLQVFIFCIFNLTIVYAARSRQKAALYISLLLATLLLLSAGYRHLSYRRYSGVKVYNVGEQLAIAIIHRAQVTLISSYDSLQSSALRYALFADLMNYARLQHITLLRLPAAVEDVLEHQLYIESLGVALLVVHAPAPTWQKVPVDISIWRHNSLDSISSWTQAHPSALILLDGSNSDAHIQMAQQQLDALQHPYYILKHNFAYVWDR